MSEKDIPINCVEFETNSAALSAGYARWTIHLKNGLAQPRESRGLLPVGYFEQFCFSSDIDRIEVFGGKSNGWFGNIRVFNLDGQESFWSLTFALSDQKSKIYFYRQTKVIDWR